MKPIRNSAKAIIIKNGKLLCTKNKDQWGYYYLLPGGGQEKNENLHNTLKRECMEEISARIEIVEILFIREYIGKNHEFAEWDSDIHQVEYMFECKLLNEDELEKGSVPDPAQTGFEWLELNDMVKYRIYPSYLKNVLGKDGRKTKAIYLGDVN